MSKHRTRRRGAATSRRCTACDHPLRAGKARRAWVMSPDGELVYGLVCNRCALRALAFVVPPALTVPVACSQCKRAPASVCAGCHERVCKAVHDTTQANVVLSAVASQRAERYADRPPESESYSDEEMLGEDAITRDERIATMGANK